MLTDKKILIIEDHPQFRELVSNILRRQEATVLAAGDGREGLEMLTEHQPDISICDIFMPVMSGHEFVIAAKANPATTHIPIIVITAVEQELAAQNATRRGAETYLLKPFNSHDLIDTIHELLREA